MVQELDVGVLRVALVLLEEQHVTRAATRLHLSVSATSRALDRCRAMFGDPLLVRQGRNVVITPRGEALRDRIRPLLDELDTLVESAPPFDPAGLRASFVIRAGEAVIAAGGGPLLMLARREAPKAEVRFDLESFDDFDALRFGSAALAIGSYSDLPSDIVTEHLVNEHLVGVVRSDHPVTRQKMTAPRFAALEQLMVSRRGIRRGPIDAELEARGLRRSVCAVVPSFAAAIAMAASSDFAAIVPRRLATALSHGAGLIVFEIPVPIPVVDVRLAWHHRLTQDPAHVWLRSCARRIVGEVDPA